MTTRTLDIYQINNKRYVTSQAAARYLAIAEDLLQDAIYTGKLKADLIASHQMIDYESLRSYAENRRQRGRGWDRVDEFLGRDKNNW